MATKQLTKQDEIDMLQDFAGELPKDSYLAMFLTPACVEYVASRIRADMPPNLFEYYDGAVLDRDAFKSRCDKQQQELIHLDETVKDLRVRLKEAQEDKQAAIDKQDRLQDQIVNRDQTIQNLRDQLNATVDVEQVRIDRIVSGYDLQIMQLKAKLFDLMEGNK